ncbi:MAG TPA: hypothetical protein VKA84_10775 [Gemmatimonadaceae bacterium]|nr:hypothetical protein [Gemmatimonadaceae bacterium]
MRVLLRALSAAALAALSCRDSTAPGDGGPLHGDREASGTLSGSDSVDRYTFRADSGAELVLSLEAVSGRLWFRLTAATDLGPVVAQDTVANGRVVRVVPIVATGTYWLDVRRAPEEPAAAGEGRYRLARWTRDRRPERAAARVSLDDTVSGERLDRPLDLDEFVVHGEEGQIVQAYAQPLAGGGTLYLTVWDEREDVGPFGSRFLGAVSSLGDGGAMEDWASGRIVLPATGDYRVRVAETGAAASDDPYVGPYRFRIAVVDPRPEHAAARLVPGDTVSAERIDAIGDVDEFTFVGEAGQQFNVFFQTLVGGPDLMQLRVVGLGPVPGTDLVARRAGPETPLLARATTRFTLPSSGTFTVRVTGESDRTAGVRGGYRVALYAVDPRPERAPAALSPGDSVVGESLDLPGDVDEFTLPLAQRTRLTVSLRRLGTQAPEVLSLELVRPSGTATTLAIVSASVAEEESVPLELDPGTYRLRVASGGTAPYAVPYELRVR